MKGIKLELLGIATILLGIAFCTSNIWGFCGGAIGFGIAAVGCFMKD